MNKVRPYRLLFALLAAQGFAFNEGAQEGYVLTCDDSWGSASWQPPAVEYTPIVDRHSEDWSTEIGTDWTQYDDAEVTLVIDPALVYTTLFGGASRDDAGRIAVDSNDDLILFGATLSADWPVRTVCIRFKTAARSSGWIRLVQLPRDLISSGVNPVMSSSYTVPSET